MSIKGENTIWKNIVDSVKAGLAYNGITGWTVIQDGQPSKTTLSAPTIWIGRVYDKRYGYQSRRPVYANSVLTEERTSYRETMFQINARKLRNPATDTELTLTASDVLNLLIDYFNGQDGIDQLQSVEMGCLRVTECRTPVAHSDSGIYEREPSFDITVSYAQETAPQINPVTYVQVLVNNQPTFGMFGQDLGNLDLSAFVQEPDYENKVLASASVILSTGQQYFSYV